MSEDTYIDIFSLPLSGMLPLLFSRNKLEGTSINILDNMTTILNVAQQSMHLYRYPRLAKETLQAWNAADILLMEYVTEHLAVKSTDKILIINDSFGALSCFFSDYHCNHWHDSFISQMATNRNLELNKLKLDNYHFIPSVENIPDTVDFIFLKIPKSLVFLEYQLMKIQQIIKTDFKLIASGMVKEIHRSTLDLFEKYMGESTTSLAKRKARLIFVTNQHREEKLKTPKNNFTKSWHCEIFFQQLYISNQANVFSRKGLDRGGELLINNIPENDFKHIIDLGCGNGIVGIAAAIKFPSAQILFIDESFMAIASTKTNVQHNISQLALNSNQYQFLVNNSLDGFIKESVDLILCNPPFHQQQTITDHIAWQMINDSYRILKNKGRLILVGNRHLKYHLKMKRIFSNSQLLHSTKNFVVLESIKSV